MTAQEYIKNTDFQKVDRAKRLSGEGGMEVEEPEGKRAKVTPDSGKKTVHGSTYVINKVSKEGTIHF